jgi:hypothetical protein
MQKATSGEAARKKLGEPRQADLLQKRLLVSLPWWEDAVDGRWGQKRDKHHAERADEQRSKHLPIGVLPGNIILLQKSRR